MGTDPIRPDGRIFQGCNEPHDAIDALPDPPPWREFTRSARVERGRGYQASEKERELVNAALYLRRPLLVTGKPGVGKSSLAHAVAFELRLGDVLVWPITTRSTLQQGLYNYDAIARLQEASVRTAQAGSAPVPVPQADETAVEVGRFLRLGPLGTAFLGFMPPAAAKSPPVSGSATLAGKRPRVLLIDEIDKSDIDLPNDLLHVFEEGEFEIPELSRLPEEERYRWVEVATADRGGHVRIERGRVHCEAFPLVILTSNGEREFPPAFLRRCLRLELEYPDAGTLQRIISERLRPGSEHAKVIQSLLDDFVDRRDRQKQELATDQLLNAIYLVMHGISTQERELLRDALLRSLSETPAAT